MRAKTINFERGGDSKASLGIGKVSEVKKILSNIYDNKRGGVNIFHYKINSLDDIHISYNPEIFKGGIVKDGDKYWWIIKFVQLPKYFLEEYSNKHTLFDREFKDHDWNIYENIPLFPEEPNKYWDKKYVLTVGKHGDEKIREMAELIIETFNKKYGIVEGFELVKSYKD